MSTLTANDRVIQAQRIAHAAFEQREVEPVLSFRRWILAGLLMRRAYLAQRHTLHAE